MISSSRLQRLLLGGAALTAAVAVLAAVFPSTVYDRFLWQYFVGPVVADAANQATAVYNGVVAHRGYNIVNELGYGLAAVYGIGVLVEVLRRFDVGTERGFVLWFTPLIVAGGLARVVEDAAVLSGATRYLFISPVIYGVVGGASLAAVAGGLAAERRGYVSDYRRVVAGTGIVAAICITVLLAASARVAAAWMLPAALGLAVVLTAVTLAVARYAHRYWDGLAGAATWEGRSVIAGHALDGSATALSIAVLGYGEKHPVSAFVMEAAGTPYAFPVVKAAVALGIVGVLYSADRDDDPLFFNLVLLGVLAVGLGPGVRNLTRAVLGV